MKMIKSASEVTTILPPVAMAAPVASCGHPPQLTPEQLSTFLAQSFNDIVYVCPLCWRKEKAVR